MQSTFNNGRRIVGVIMTEFKDAEYITTKDGVKQIKVKIDGVESWVMINTDNRHYVEMMEQVDADTLTIKDED